MISLIKQMLSEDNGNLSSMRVLVGIIIVAVLFNWTWFNIKSGNISSFEWQDLLAIIGPLFAKGYQKDKEVKKNE